MKIDWKEIASEALVEARVQMEADLLVKPMPDKTTAQKTAKKIARDAHVKRLREEAKKARAKKD